MFDVRCSAFDVFMQYSLRRPGRQSRRRLSASSGPFVGRLRRGGPEWLEFFADPHEPSTVENDDQRACIVQNRGDDGIQIAEGSGRPAAQNEADAEQKILV